MQELKRQIMRKLDKVEDRVLLDSILEMLNDHDSEEDEEGEEATSSVEREDNRKLPPPTTRRFKDDAESWLDGLGR